MEIVGGKYIVAEPGDNQTHEFDTLESAVGSATAEVRSGDAEVLYVYQLARIVRETKGVEIVEVTK